jgi:pimeloyl-ACP methyl ester carboxylesterase
VGERLLRRRWTSLAGAPVHSRETRDAGVQLGRRGPAPLVLVHGLAVSSTYFVPFLEVCADAGVPAVAPDLPGIGHTPRRAGEVVGGTADVAGQARFVAAWLEHRRLEPPVTLVGNSLGAQVAVELARLRPAVVRGLVLVGPTADPSETSALGQLGALLADVPRERPSLPPAVALEVLRTDPRLLRDRAVTALDHHVAERLAGVDVPTVVVRGADDPLVSRRWAVEVARAGRGELIEVPGGHAVHHSAPRHVLSAARSVLV